MHDKYGHPLQLGDDVLIHATVSECHTGTEEYCNITVKAVEPMFPGEDHTTINLNAKQVMKAKKGHGPGGVTILGETIGPGRDGETDPPGGGG